MKMTGSTFVKTSRSPIYSKSTSVPAHPTTQHMVDNAIKTLKERGGSSLHAIKKYLASNYEIDIQKLAPFVRKYLKSAVTSGKLIQTKGKGASGSFKLSASASKETKAKKPARKSTWIWVKTDSANAKPGIKSSAPQLSLAGNNTETDKTKTARKSGWIWLKADTVHAKPTIKAHPVSKTAKNSQMSKKLAKAPTHPTTQQMVDDAIKSLKQRAGSSLPAIKKYLKSTYKIDPQKLAPFIKKYLKSAVTSGKLIQTKGRGASGSFKLSKEIKTEKPARKSAWIWVKTDDKPAIKSSAPQLSLARNKTKTDKTKTFRKGAWTWVKKHPVHAEPTLKPHTVIKNSATKSAPKPEISKKLANPPTHPTTQQMVDAAIRSLNERKGSSLPTIKKYLTSTYKFDAQKFSPFIKKYLKSAVSSGKLIQTKGKGASGSFRLSAAALKETN